MKSIKKLTDFNGNISSGERLYLFPSNQEKDLQNSIKKIKDYLNGISASPEIRKETGAYFVSQVILDNNNSDISDCFDKYKPKHPIGKKLPMGKPNPEDRFLRWLSVWIESGAISIKNHKIIFETILLNRLKQTPNPLP